MVEQQQATWADFDSPDDPEPRFFIEILSIGVYEMKRGEIKKSVAREIAQKIRLIASNRCSPQIAEKWWAIIEVTDEELTKLVDQAADD
jgi:hypothetical protein